MGNGPAIGASVKAPLVVLTAAKGHFVFGIKLSLPYIDSNFRPAYNILTIN